MIFAAPHYLTALAVVPLMVILLLLVWLRRRRILAGMGDRGLLERLSQSYSGDRRAIKMALALGALTCALLSAARPQAGLQLTRGTARGIDLIIALDVSASMLAQDVKPSRLERTKTELSALISSMEGSRIGIIAFAGSATPACPLTADSRAARMFLDALEWGVVEEPGTDLGKAISRALASFDATEERSRAILIVSDGEDHEGGYVEATKRAVEAGVPVFCVGVGGEDGVPIPSGRGGASDGFRKDSNGEIVLTKLNSQILRETAFSANGSMHVIGPSGGNLSALKSEIKSLPMKERPTTYTHRGERFHVVAMIAFCLLLLDWFVGDRRRVPAAIVLAMAVLIGTAVPAGASSRNDAVKLYREGDYLGALVRFREALEKDPAASLHYDIGNSLYRLEKYDQAARQYAGSLSVADSSLQRDARYNTGNCLFKSGDLQGAIEQYIEALKVDPNDQDAKHNLELARRLLQESHSQEQSGGDQEQDGDESQENKPQEGGEKTDGERRQEQDREESGQSGQESGENMEEQGGRERPRTEEGQGARFSEEEAKRLLEALAGEEKDLLSKRLKSKVRRKGVKKNW